MTNWCGPWRSGVPSLPPGEKVRPVSAFAGNTAVERIRAVAVFPAKAARAAASRDLLRAVAFSLLAVFASEAGMSWVQWRSFSPPGEKVRPVPA
jgi:hypothetical protein